MTSGIDAPKRRYLAWLRPVHVVVLGTVVIAILLLAPIRIGPGSHEDYASCGNALDMDLRVWRSAPHDSEQAYYLNVAYRSCTVERVDRLAQSVGVLSVTLLIVAFMTRRSRAPR